MSTNIEQNLKTFEAALMDNYLPVWRNQLGIEPSPLLSKIKRVPLASNNLVSTAPVGLSGGFGFSEEGKATPIAGKVNMQRFTENAKDMYVNVVISHKAVQLATSGGAMADALETEIKGAYDTAKWNLGRALHGTGLGVLAKVVSVSGQVITVDTVKDLKEGLIVDIHDSTATTATDVINVQACRILNVDRANSTITTDGTLTGLAANDFITVQNSYGNEITGLGAIFDSNISTIYGVTKSSNPFVNPIVYDANNDLDDGMLTKVLRMAERDKNSKIDMLLCGDDAYDNYANYLRENNYRIEEMTHELKGGFKAIKFVFGNRVVDVVNDSFVPDSQMWGVETGCLELHDKDWNFAELRGGGIFNLMENSANYRALLTNFGNLICSNPGGCVKITNADASA